MAKIVRYNGGTESYYSCSDPAQLVLGGEYVVVAEEEGTWQTNYILEGVDGKFNSAWFTNAPFRTNATFMAIAHTAPIVGQRYKCTKLEIVNGKIQLSDWRTSIVRAVVCLEKNIYSVTTCNSTYIVQVG